MGLIKIGKYIAGKRKKQGLTQRQVAEKLGIWFFLIPAIICALFAEK